MLFNRNRNQRNRTQRTIVIVQTQKPKLSNKVKNLSIPCPNGLSGKHLPVLLNFIGSSISKSGNSIGRFKCPLCGHKEGWMQHNQNGKAIRVA